MGQVNKEPLDLVARLEEPKRYAPLVSGDGLGRVFPYMQQWADGPWIEAKHYDALLAALKTETERAENNATRSSENYERAERLGDACRKLSAALSRIDYICGEPNEMECSGYDVHMNEGAVVEHVRVRLTTLREETRAKAFRELAKRLADFYAEWSPRCRNGTEYGEGDWQWLAGHMRDIAKSYAEPEMSDKLKARKEAAIRALPAQPGQAAQQVTPSGAVTGRTAGITAPDCAAPHTDHPSRVWDRTCPGCLVDGGERRLEQRRVLNNGMFGTSEYSQRQCRRATADRRKS